jgi:hypothetical protein
LFLLREYFAVNTFLHVASVVQWKAVLLMLCVVLTRLGGGRRWRALAVGAGRKAC